jgi:cob(I)alamin adenosyltransferase
MKGVQVVRIYTRTGDDGTTGLIGGARVAKDSLRIDAYGTIDELNSILGVVLAQGVPETVRQVLSRIQDVLFTIGAGLAVSAREDQEKHGIPSISEADIQALEIEIDRCDAELPPLDQFILPGGTEAAAMLHLARTVARRAERCCVSLAHSTSMDPRVLIYLNRLSDLCFVLARHVNHGKGVQEAHPTFGQGR